MTAPILDWFFLLTYLTVFFGLMIVVDLVLSRWMK